MRASSPSLGRAEEGLERAFGAHDMKGIGRDGSDLTGGKARGGLSWRRWKKGAVTAPVASGACHNLGQLSTTTHRRFWYAFLYQRIHDSCLWLPTSGTLTQSYRHAGIQSRALRRLVATDKRVHTSTRIRIGNACTWPPPRPATVHTCTIPALHRDLPGQPLSRRHDSLLSAHVIGATPLCTPAGVESIHLLV